MKRWYPAAGLCVLLLAVAAIPAGEKNGGPEPTEVQPVVDKALAYLKGSQQEDGSFSPKLAGPGITALTVAALLRNGVSPKEPTTARALDYLEKQVRPDGGVYNKFLANYTTSVAIMAFKEANRDGKYNTVLQNAGKFLQGIQQETDPKNPAFGGFGYDAKKRPDLSNTNFTVEALLAAGMSKDDPAIKNALTFIGRCQNLPGEEGNDQPFAKNTTKDNRGGFTYTPFYKEDSPYHVEGGGLRSLGGMTYGGLKSMLYAGVDKNDPRVKAAIGWIREHYTLDENPGMGKAGLYYYYHTFAKAMDALGEEPFADAKGQKHDWRRELFDKMKATQQANGSWRNTGERTFMEDNADLATSFALLSLGYTRPGKR